MRVFLYGMKERARDENNYYHIDHVRDLYLEEMTFDLRDEYYSVLCYRKKLDEHILQMYGYEYIGTKDIGEDDWV